MSPARRRRFNSRDYPRSYSGQYGQNDDLLPLELQRHRPSSTTTAVTMMIGLYFTMIVIIQLLAALVLLVPTAHDSSSSSSSSYGTDGGGGGGGMDSDTNNNNNNSTTTITTAYSPLSWTVSNAIHTALTLLYLHWLKGSLYDDSGEMNALTVWEQWEANGTDSRAVREACMIIPCLLAWMACHAADYAPAVSACNLFLWVACLLPKMSFMNGVRLFGINRTAGIDDDDDDDDDKTNNNDDDENNHTNNTALFPDNESTTTTTRTKTTGSSSAKGKSKTTWKEEHEKKSRKNTYEN